MINFYSDRTSDTGAHNVSSGIITDSVNNIQPFFENASWKRPQYYNCPQLKINNQRVGRLPTLCIIYHRLLKIQVKRTITDWNGRIRTDTDGVRFSISEYSEDEQRDIVDVLKPFTGSIVDKSP